MELHVGSRLAHFEILGLLGAGGMGEVYRALDTKLKREVAIKVLPPQFAEHSDRLARFEQEAVLLASLNHPHIAAIYGVEHVDGVPCLVLELVEGPTLTDRLMNGPIPVPEAIKIAGQIADALEAAHEKGIVHRDLKPANVKLTSDGKVKVLDFGLAKAFGAAQSDRSAGTALNAGRAALTQAREETQAGLVMGTASYMSPEQAEGRPVDKRTDVWSFGVLLYEMLTGKRLFDGKSDAHVLVHVMEQEPDWTKLPPLPNGVQALMERCLQKDSAQRLRDIGDVRLMLQASATHPMRPVSPVAHRAPASRRWLWPAVAGAAIVAAFVVGAIVRQDPAPAPPAAAVRFDIDRTQTQSSPFIAISPDGARLAFIAVDSTPGGGRIWVRSLETQEARPLDATSLANGVPFWSADSRYIIFSSQGKLRRVDAAGGPAQLLADLSSMAVGGFALADGPVVYAELMGGAKQVPSSGGTPSALDLGGWDAKGALTPSAMPGGSFVYCECQGAAQRGIYVATPGGGPPRQILPDVSLVQYAPSPDPDVGYVLFLRGGGGAGDVATLMAQAIHPRQLRLLGEPVAIAERVRGFSASATGVLVYSQDSSTVPSSIPGILRGQLTWFDRQGHVISTVGDPGIYRIPVLSPDGQFVAMERADPATQNVDVYVFEFARGVNNRFTFDPARDVQPVWTPDGTSVIFSRMLGATGAEWYRRSANLAGDEEFLFRARDLGVASSISPDGRFLLFTGPLPGPANIQAVDLSRVLEAREAIPIVTSDFNEANARFSPDGRWFAYASNESGTVEIYVRPFNPNAAPGEAPSAGGQIMISKGGGSNGGAFWRADGKELLYMARDGTVMSVAVETQPTFRVNGPPTPLFKGPANVLFFDVSSDGERFLIPVPEGAGASPPPYKVVLNWTSTLR
jgi:serine/threonine protein kinase